MSDTNVPVHTDSHRAVAKPEQGSHETTWQLEKWVAPPVDIFETEDGLIVVADLPGVSNESLTIEVKNDLLTLQATANVNFPGNPVYQEFQLGGFFRQFRLADTVDTSRIEAELKHGVLTLHLPKAEAAKPRKIEVKVA